MGTGLNQPVLGGSYKNQSGLFLKFGTYDNQSNSQLQVWNSKTNLKEDQVDYEVVILSCLVKEKSEHSNTLRMDEKQATHTREHQRTCLTAFYNYVYEGLSNSAKHSGHFSVHGTYFKAKVLGVH